MTRVEPYTKPDDRWIRCPACGKEEWRVNHIGVGKLLRSFGPWYCHECGMGITGLALDDGSIEIEPARSRLAFATVTLDLIGPVRVVVSDTIPVDNDESVEPDQLRYLYEEHLDPADVLARVDTLATGEIEFVSAALVRSVT